MVAEGNPRRQAASDNNSVLEHALRYLRGGMSILPVKLDGTKSPAASEWTSYMTALMSEDTARRIWGGKNPPGIATIGGKVSGNLEHLDFDHEADVIYPKWCEEVEGIIPGLVARLCILRRRGPAIVRSTVLPTSPFPATSPTWRGRRRRRAQSPLPINRLAPTFSSRHEARAATR